MRKLAWMCVGLALALGGCAHVAGVVEESPDTPLSTAVFSVGRPDGISVDHQYHVDASGRFDFKIPTFDQDNLYVFDGSGGPRLTMRRVDRTEISDHMRIFVPRARSDMDFGPETP